MAKEKIIVSACLLGNKVRYDGNDSFKEEIATLKEKYDLIPVCPEVLGGLSIPRDPAEITGNFVLTNKGTDVTVNFNVGAETVLDLCKANHISKAIMKSKSPSCGKGKIYDGSFSRRLIEGNGITVELLLKNNIKVYTENELGGF
ncbi:MAG: DUF523 domain-containing protein [Clostridiaceae bacterium]